MTESLDQLIRGMKWPVALGVAAMTPAAAWGLWLQIEALSGDPSRGFPAWTGFGLYLGLWLVFFRRPRWGSLFSTFEHELTHAIFALGTLHRVRGMGLSWRSGGHLTISGELHWLILAAPYFFPTVSVLVLAALALLPGAGGPVGASLLGASLAYHFTSNWHQTRVAQSDLRRVGIAFAALFLPGANLLACGALLACYQGDTEGLVSFARFVGEASVEILGPLGGGL